MDLQQAKKTIAPQKYGKPKESIEHYWGRMLKTVATAKPQNPLIEEYLQPDNTQNPQPPLKGIQMPMYLPANNSEEMHPRQKEDGSTSTEPVHVMEMKTRKQIMCDTTKEMSGIYKNYLFSWLCLLATIVIAVFVNPYLAAIPAYAAGHFWSEKCIDVGWSVQWYKGKTLISAA